MICLACEQDKPLRGFRSLRNGLYHKVCKLCEELGCVPLHQPDYGHIWRRYKLSREGYDAMLAGQRGNCKVCLEFMRPPCVDHNHATDEVRGLLCRKCNFAIGGLQDSRELCKSASTYLHLANPIELVRADTPWGCAFASWAMALGLKLHELYALVGHNGGEKVWPHLPDPACRRSIHPQEIYPLARAQGFAVQTIERQPSLMGQNGEILTIDHNGWFYQQIATGYGVVGGATKRGYHGVYCKAGEFYDPRGAIFRFDEKNRDFSPEIFWQTHRISPFIP